MRVACVLLLLLTAGCQTHTVADCRPPCEADDQVVFANCVANGVSPCAAGDRRCCALETGCIGMLDDQRVDSTLTCETFTEDTCWPPCDATDESDFFVCVDDGISTCAPGDVDCCALSVDCLGELGEEVVVVADGCCVDQLDCLADEVCDPMTWECVPGTPGMVCGNEIMEGTEECDDGNTETDACPYGLMSCEVCAIGCVLGPGVPSFCGDGSVDPVEEDCEPPSTTVCDASCQFLAPSTCGNGSFDGDETDLDCGGSCPPCAPGQACEIHTDCASGPMCSSTPECDPDRFVCIELAICDDSVVCTADVCLATGGCTHDPLDQDMDGFGPRSLGCGTDCDDTDRSLSPGNMFDSRCDGRDDDCDDLIDEDC